MGDAPTSPRFRRKAGGFGGGGGAGASNPYAAAAAGIPAPAGSIHSSSGTFWHGYVQGIVRTKAPAARIYSTCSSGTGNTRYLFTGIDIQQIDDVKRALSMRLFGMVEHGFVTTNSHASGATDFRDETKIFYVDVLPDADETLKRRRHAFRFLCSPYLLVLIVCLLGMWWSGSAFIDHYRTHDQPFERHINAFKETADRMWDSVV